MSIQSYLQKVYYDDRIHARNESPAPLTTKEGMTAEFQVNIMTTQGMDRTVARSSTFTVVGGNGSTITGILQYGSIVAEHIAKMSYGVISGLFLKLGKYRSDEIPQDVATGDNSSGVVDLTNNPSDEFRLSACDSAQRNQYPAKNATARIYIPWKRFDISDVDVNATLEDLQDMTIDGAIYNIGHNKFYDENCVDIVAYPTRFVKNMFTKNTSRKSLAFLANNDVESGIIPDNVSSEMYATINNNYSDDSTGNDGNLPNPPSPQP